MQIIYDEKSRVFKIDTKNSSYMIGLADQEGFAGHMYYGPRLAGTDLRYCMRLEENPFVPSVNARDRGSFLDAFPSEFPGNGVGDYRESAVEVRDENGQSGVQFLYKSHRIFSGKPKLAGLPATFGGEDDCMTLELCLEDPVLSLEAKLLYSVFEENDAIARSVRLINHSKSPVVIQKIMSMSLDMDDREYQMLSLHGSWERERHIQKTPVSYGRQSVGSARGESSHQEHPFVALISPGADQERGEVYGFHFVYSGNFLAQVEKSQYDSLRVSVGIHPKDFSWRLEGGESFIAPEVILVYSGQGLGGMTRTYHDLYRNHLIRSPYKDKKRPILINNWEATYFQFDSDKLISIAREAKKDGIEMLVMDDGWFGKRDDDNSSLGDWFVNEKKLKGGLKPLVDEINRIGLKFGIWFEPEMVSPDSGLYRAHPDWAIALPGREPCRVRNQYVLDLTRPEAAEYVYNCVAAVLHSANIEYVKWDMNRALSDAGSAYLDKDRQGELMHRYLLAVYALQERLITEFPELLLENCSSGGARFDPGMLYYSPQIWCSDDTDAIERLGIQEGTALLYPLSTIGAHVADCPNHLIGRVTPFETRGHVALAGTFGYELDITKIPQKDREQIPKQVALYHKYNDLIRNGDYYRIASYADTHQYDCYEVVAKDRSEALITYVQVLCSPNVRSRSVRIPGLDRTKRYCVEETGQVFGGDALAYAGMLIPPLKGDFQSMLIHLVETGRKEEV